MPGLVAASVGVDKGSQPECEAKLFYHRVASLGHVVTAQGNEMDPEKVTAVATWPVPQNVEDVDSLHGFATISLTTKGVQFV